MADTHDHGNSGSLKEELKPAAEAAEYWTEERRKAAKPYPMPKGHEGGKAQAHEVPKSDPGHAPTGHGSEKEASHHGAAEAHTLVANPLVFPYRTVGKLYFTQGGSGFSGSAAIVAPNVLLTAGHCVYANGQWSSNVVFFPSYGKRAGNDPFYRLVCGRLSCRTVYTKSYDRAHDYGMIWMPTGPGNTLGYVGPAWGQSTAGRVADAYGYPATPNPPYNGEQLCSAHGTYTSGAATGTVGLTNDNMEHGSSGGPWFTTIGNSLHTNGLQSFHVHDGDTVEYGPYFTDEVKTLLDYITNPANH